MLDRFSWKKQSPHPRATTSAWRRLAALSADPVAWRSSPGWSWARCHHRSDHAEMFMQPCGSSSLDGMKAAWEYGGGSLRRSVHRRVWRSVARSSPRLQSGDTQELSAARFYPFSGEPGGSHALYFWRAVGGAGFSRRAVQHRRRRPDLHGRDLRRLCWLFTSTGCR